MNPEFAKIIITQKKNMTIISRGTARANIKVQTLNKSLFFVFVALDLAACLIGMGSGNPVIAFVLTGFDFLLFAFAFEYFNYKQVWRLSFYVRCLSLPLVFFSQTYLFLYGFAAATGLPGWLFPTFMFAYSMGVYPLVELGVGKSLNLLMHNRNLLLIARRNKI